MNFDIGRINAENWRIKSLSHQLSGIDYFYKTRVSEKSGYQSHINCLRTEGMGNGTRIILGSIANFLYKTGYHSITVDFSYDDNQSFFTNEARYIFRKKFCPH